jgi:GH24 family phage-related lysozyme (muramidase)
MIKYDEDIVKYLKDEERFEPAPYTDTTKKAIGYGQNNYDPKLKNVTKAQADKMLRRHLDGIQKEFATKVKRSDLTKEQITVLYDMAYNLGVGGTSEILKRVNAGDDAAVAKAIELYTKATYYKQDANGNKLKDKDGNYIEELREVPALVKRKDKRLKLWNQPSDKPAGGGTALSFDALDSMYQKNISEEERTDLAERSRAQVNPNADLTQEDIDMNPLEDDNFDMSFDELEAAHKKSTVVAKPNIRKQLDKAAIASDEGQALVSNEAYRLNREYDIPLAEARKTLEGKTFNEVVASIDADLVSRRYGKAAKWATNPDNYVVYRQDPETMKKLDDEVGAFKSISDSFVGQAGKAAYRAYRDQTPAAYYLAQHSLGKLSQAELIAELRAIDERKAADEPLGYQTELSELGRIQKSAEKKTVEGIKGIQKFMATDTNRITTPTKNITKAYREAIKSGALTVEGWFDILAGYVKRPKASTIILGQSAPAMVTPLATGAAATAVAGPVAGKLTAGATAMPFQFASYIQGQMEEFRGKDGKIDYEKFFQTVNYKEVEEAALIYAGSASALEIVQFSMVGNMFAKVLGKEAVKETAKATVKTGLTSALKKTGQLGSAWAKGALQEGAQEFTQEAIPSLLARSSREDLGDISVEEYVGIAFDSTAEGIIGAKMGAITTPIAGYAKYRATKKVEQATDSFNKRKDEKVNKAKAKATAQPEQSPDEPPPIPGEIMKARVATVVDTVDSATNSVNAFEGAQKIRKTINESKVKDKYGESVRTLIDSILSPEQKAPTKALSEQEVDALENNIDEAMKDFDTQVVGNKNYVSIAAADLNDILIIKGLDPKSVIKKFGSTIYSDYVKAQADGNDVHIDASEWFLITKDLPELDAVVRFNGAEYNALEGETVIRDFVSNPYAAFDMTDKNIETGDTPPPVPKESGATPPPLPETNFTYIAEQLDPYGMDTNMMQVEPVSEFKNSGEREVYSKIRASLFGALNHTNMTDSEKGIAAQIEFGRVKARAQMLGRDIRDLKDRFTITKMTKEEEASSPGTLAFADQMIRNPDFDFRVAFSRRSDVATVMHELGHTWLYELSEDWNYVHNIPEAELTPQQLAYREAMDDLNDIFTEKGFIDDGETLADVNNREWLSLGKTNPAEFERKRKQRMEMHETFAQTAEKFFLEGDFSDTKWKRVLETFRKFFTAIMNHVGRAYESMGIFPLEIDPKVQRIFKSVLNIGDAADNMLYPMLSEPTFDPNIFGKKSGEYLNAIRKYHEEAISIFYGRAMKQSMIEREKEIARMKDVAYNEAARRVDKNPSMQILRDFEGAMESFKKGETEVNPTISYESFVREIFSNNTESADKYKSQISPLFVGGKKKGGTDVRDVMYSYNISNPADLIRTLIEASSRDKMIDQEANNIFEQLIPSLKDNEQLHLEAMNAVNNKARHTVLNMEMRMMMDNAITQYKKLVGVVASPAGDLAKKIDPVFIKAQADKIVRETRLKLLKTSTFLRRSDRYGRSAHKKFTRGDFIGAFDDKQMQAVYFEAYKVAEGYRREVSKARAELFRINRRSMKTLGKDYDTDVVMYLKAVASLIKKNQVQRIPKLNVENFYNSDLIMQSQVEGINAELDRFKTLMQGKFVGDPTVEAWMAQISLQRKLVHLARKNKEIEIGDRKGNMLMAVSKGNAEIILGKSVDDFSKVTEDQLILRAEKNQKTKIMEQKASAYNLYNYADQLVYTRSILTSMFESDEEFVKSEIGRVYYQAVEASHRHNLAFMESLDNIQKAARKTIRKDGALAKLYMPLVRLLPVDKFRHDPIPAPKLGVTFKDKSELLMLMLYAGSETGRIAAMGGGYEGKVLGTKDPIALFLQIGETDISDLIATIDDLYDKGIITESDIEFVNTTFDEFAKYHEEVKDAIRYTDGYTPGTIKAKSYQTKAGLIKGGYVPLQHHSEVMSERQLRDGLLDLEFDRDYIMDLYPEQNLSMVKRRGGGVHRLEFSLARLPGHLKNHIKVAQMRKTMYNTGKFFKHPVTHQALNSRRENIYEDTIRPWFERTTSQQYLIEEDKSYNKVASFLRRGTFVKAFFLDVPSALLQYTGLSPAIKEIGFINVSRSVVLNLKSPAAVGRAKERIGNISTSMKSRFSNHTNNLVRELDMLNLNQGFVYDAQQFGIKYAGALMQITQTHVDIAVFDSAYNKALGELKMTKAQAERYAYDMVVKTQSSTDISEAPSIFRTQSFIKAFSQFGTYTVAAFNQYYTALAQGSDRSAIQRASALTGVAAFTTLVPSIIQSMIDLVEGSLMESEEDKRKRKAKLRKDRKSEAAAISDQVLLNMAHNMAGQIVPLIGDKMTRMVLEKKDIRFAPIFGIKDDAQKVIHAADNATYGVDPTDKEWWALMNMFTSTTSIPVSAINGVMKMGKAVKPAAEQRKDERERKKQLKKMKKIKAKQARRSE